MGDSGAAPQQRPSERYWFFPPASRRPWRTTRSRLRKTWHPKAEPGIEGRAQANRAPRPRQPRHPGPLRRCSRCLLRCFRRLPRPCPQARPPLPRPLRRTPGRPWHPGHRPQPRPPVPRLPAGPGPPRRPGLQLPLEPALRQRLAAPLRRPLPRPLQRRPEQPGEVLPRCPGRRPRCRGPVERPPAAPRRPTPPGPARLAVWGTTRRPPARFPRRAPSCQRRCPSTRASPSPRGRRRPPEHRKDRDRQFPPPVRCPACPMPWCGWAPDWLAWVPPQGWYSSACAAPKGGLTCSGR